LISIRPQGRLCSDSGEAVLQWAIAGLGIAEGPSFLASDAIESGALEPLLLDYARPEYGIYVVRPPAAHVPGKVRVPIDTLVERFGGEPLLGPLPDARAPSRTPRMMALRSLRGGAWRLPPQARRN
jgi:DNA-binding transcriptional LysR family regulator